MAVAWPGGDAGDRELALVIGLLGGRQQQSTEYQVASWIPWALFSCGVLSLGLRKRRDHGNLGPEGPYRAGMGERPGRVGMGEGRTFPPAAESKDVFSACT